MLEAQKGVATSARDVTVNPRGPDVVVLIHGIRTTAEWAELVRDVLQQIPDVTVVPIGYGYFDVIRFLLPGPTRRPPVHRIRRELTTVRSNHPTSRLTVIAHSFGTYIISRILVEEPDPSFWRIVLCGAIVPQTFRWDLYGHRVEQLPIVNECGTRDIWPILARVTWGYGPSGTFGFRSANVVDRFHDFGHAGFFTRGFVEAFWKPLVGGHSDVRATILAERRRAPTWQHLLARTPLRWIIVMLMMVAGVWALDGLRTRSGLSNARVPEPRREKVVLAVPVPEPNTLEAEHRPDTGAGSEPGPRERVAPATMDRSGPPITLPPIESGKGRLIVSGCPAGTRVVVDGEGQNKESEGGAPIVRALDPGFHAVELIRRNYETRTDSVEVDPMRPVDLPCLLIPDLRVEWTYPVTDLMATMRERCEWELRGPAVSASLDLSQRQLQLVDKARKSCVFSVIRADGQGNEAILNERAGKLFAKIERDNETVATFVLTANADVTELTGTVTDSRTGAATRLALRRGAPGPITNCRVEGTSQARSGPGLLEVRAVDQRAGPLPDADVLLITTRTSYRRRSDATGLVKLEGEPGDYRITVQYPGFQDEFVEGVRLTANRTTHVECTLFVK